MDEAIIYTDGSSGVDRNGGWAAIIHTELWSLEISGSETNTTSNRMEMMAAIMGLKELGSSPHVVDLVSDSAYLLNSLRWEWYRQWLADEASWTALGNVYVRPNMDLWRELDFLANLHKIQCVKVKGHTGDHWNEYADKVAKYARLAQISTRGILTPESVRNRTAHYVGTMRTIRKQKKESANLDSRGD